MGTLDALGKRIWDAPRSDVKLTDLISWLEERCKEGNRILAIDPVTAADSGSQPWQTDRQFVLLAKTILRDAGASLIVVTHPRGGKQGKGTDSHLDNLAGGRAWGRFTQTVLLLDSQPEIEDMTVRRYLAENEFKESLPVNRILKICKARNGPGQGWEVGYLFESSLFSFSEQGSIVKNSS